MASASGVRAKAALFGQLGAGGSQGGGTGREMIGLSSSSSSAMMRLPPTSSAPNTSISHPLPAKQPFQSRATASAIPPSTTRIARRTPVSIDPIDDADLGEYAANNIEQAPLPPVKPYAPKLSENAPQTPFQVEFPRSTGNSPASQRIQIDGNAVDSSTQRRIPQTRIPRYTAAASTSSNSPTSTRTAIHASTEAALEKLANAADELSRESLYSVTSAVVTTANAVNFQRSAAQSRAMRGAATQQASSSSMATTNDSASGRAASVDKGIGVKVRRKSRESSTSERRRPKSGGRNSSTPTAANAGPSIRVIEPRISLSSTVAGEQSERRDAYDAAVQRGQSSRGLNPSGGETEAVDRAAGASTKTLSDESGRLTPRDAAVVRTERTTADVSASEMVRSTSIASTSYEVRNLNSMYAFDPLSDAWGQNSDVANLSVDDDLSSMGALSFSSPNSPVGQRTPARPAGLTNLSTSTSSSANERRSNDLVTPSSAKDVALAAHLRTIRSPDQIRNENDAYMTSAPSQSSSQHFDNSTVANDREMANDSGYGSAPPPSKDSLLTQLLSSMSLVDTQSFEALASLEQVEALKRELSRVEKRIEDVQHKLKVQMRMRDAADKLRRSGTRKRSATTTASNSNGTLSASGSNTALPLPTSSAAAGSTKGHQRRLSTTSSVAGGALDVQQAEADVAAATKRCDQVSRDLMELFGVASKMRRRLLEHHASVLAIRVKELESDLTNARSTLTVQKETIVDVAALTASEERANVAERELKRVQGKIAQVEQVLNRERERHDGEKRQLRQTHEQQTKELARKHQLAIAEHQTSLSEHQSALNDATAKLRSVGDQRNEALAAEKARTADVQRRSEAQAAEIAEKEQAYRGLQAQMAQLEFETTAERNIMLDRQKLFSAFEHRLERAEKRLREQDDRCARMLGKAEGREEMDDLLNQIKYGSAATDAKKNKTAGQDIDGLIDSLTTHIDDVEDELQRVAGMRGFDDGDDSEYGAGGDPQQRRGQHDVGALRELTVELQSSQREAEEWRTQAESAKRQLAAVQRQSALSMSSTNAGGGGGAQLSTSYGAGGWGTQSNAGAGFRTRLNSVRSAAELEARVALLEKRNAALEAELTHVRDEQAMHVGISSSSESGVIVGGREDTSMHQKVAGSTSDVDGGLYAQTITGLLDVLPYVNDNVDDLHELQEELETAPNNDQMRGLAGSQVCKEVQERARKMMFVGRNLVGRALAMEMERRDLDEEMGVLAQEREDAKAALEDLRTGHASQMQVIEAGKSREQQLNVKVHQLEQRLTEMRHTIESNMLAASKANGHGAIAQKSTLSAANMRASRSLGSLGVAAAGGGAGLSATRRNVMPVKSARSVSAATKSSATNPSLSLAPLISPTSTKLSFGSSAAPIASSSSTTTTSFPNLSPADVAASKVDVGGGGTENGPDVGMSRSPSSARLLSVQPSSGPPPRSVTTDREDAQSFRSISSTTGDQRGGAAVSSTSTSAAAAAAAATTPRTMMLGMGTPQMMQRIRELEAELVQSKLHVQRAKTDDDDRLRVEQQLHDCRAELATNRREIDDIRNVESRQRIELLEELTSLTSELSDARAQIRRHQQSNSSSTTRPRLQTALQQKVLNI